MLVQKSWFIENYIFPYSKQLNNDIVVQVTEIVRNSYKMNVAIKNSPFQREVREWQRVDPNTGALMSGRMQADRWNNGHANKYGKVSY